MPVISTGSGQITIDSKVPPGGVRAVLSNFDIDSATVKAEHRFFLDREVVPRLVAQSARIWLQGSASHSGTDAHNLDLSRRRVNNVVAYLRTRGVLDSQMIPDAVGESLAVPGVNEDQRDRAVSLLVAPLNHPTPPPVLRPQPPPPPTNTAFRIRILGGLSAGAVFFQLDQLYFQIWDQGHALSCFYQYTSGGMGKSLKLPLSVTLRGPWNDFNTTRPLQVTDFGGPARFTSGGAGPYTVNYLNMIGLPSGASTIPASLSISTGFTLGLGVGTTVGAMMPADRTPWPFSGP